MYYIAATPLFIKQEVMVANADYYYTCGLCYGTFIVL